MKKHEEGLTEEELDNQIGKIHGELLPKEKPEKPNLQNVIVDGYIFEIDRSVPKIVDYIGPANGIIITAYVTGNDGWVKPDETVTVNGSIKKYGGGTVTSSSATATNGVTIPIDFPTNGGSFAIPNISVDTDITITATDSEGETVNKKIEVRIKRDVTAPTVEIVTTRAEGLTIKFSATGHDKNAEGQEGSGIDYFTYTITSTQDTALEGIPADKRTGRFTKGQTIEIETTSTGDREETTYIIKVTATDNCKNTTLDANAKTENVTVIDGLTIEQAKELVNENTLQRFIGTRITDYNPPAGGTYRVFYYDAEDDGNGNGYFGYKNTLYLKRDESIKVQGGVHDGHKSSDDGNIMKKMNPKWSNSENGKSINLRNEYNVAWLSDPSVWKDYKMEGIASFAIGCSSIEMFIKSYNVYKQNNPNDNILSCDIGNENGYSVKGSTKIESGKRNIFSSGESWNWLSSPGSIYYTVLCLVGNSITENGGADTVGGNAHPIVAIYK